MPEPTRKLAAIVFTDIVGYTKLAAENEPAALSLLEEQREILKPIVEEYSGNWLKEMGDGLLLTFNTNLEAVNCAIAIQNAVKDIDNLNLRIGIHNGEVVFQGNDVVGDDVNITARVEPFAAPGGIAISDRVNASLERDPEFSTKLLGTPDLKGVKQKVEVFYITSHNLPETDLSQVSAKLEPQGFQWNLRNSIGIAASVIGLLFLLNFFFLRIGYADKDETPSIAILPFENKGAEADEFYAYGISSDLIADVTSAGLIRVAGLNDIEKLEYNKMSYGDLSDELFVRYVAKGTLWKMDSVFQLSMEIYDTKESKVVYTKRWQTDWKDLATIKDDLSDNILETLEIQILEDSETHVAESNPEAYEYYLRGKHKFGKRKNLDDIEIARGLFRKAIELDEHLLEAQLDLGVTYQKTGDYDQAMDIYKPVLEIAKLNNNQPKVAHALNSIGIIHSLKGENDTALDYFLQALEIKTELGNEFSSHSNLNNIGIIYAKRGDYDQALDYFNRTVKIHQEQNNKPMEMAMLGNIGVLYERKGEYDQAMEHAKTVLDYAKETDNIVKASISYLNIAHSHNGQFENDLALDNYKTALELFLELGDKDRTSISQSHISQIYFRMGEIELAIDYKERALQVQKEMNDTESVAWSFVRLGFLNRLSGNFEIAIDHLTQAFEFLEENEDHEMEFYSNLILNRIKKEKGEPFDRVKLLDLLADVDEIEYLTNFRLYELLGNKSYIETAHTQLLDKVDVLDHDLKEKFLNYPIPKQIVEAWEKVQS